MFSYHDSTTESFIISLEDDNVRENDGRETHNLAT